MSGITKTLGATLLLAALALVCAPPARAAVTNVQALVTFTNVLNGTTNGHTITVNGDIRRYTNGTLNNAASWILSTNTVGWSATNTWLHLATYTPLGVDRIYTTNTNALIIVGTFRTNTALAVSVSSGVGTVTYATNVWAEAYPLMHPNGSLATEAARTNNASGLIELLNDNRQSNAVNNGVAALSNLLDRISQQTASNKVFRVVTNDGVLSTNAWSSAGSNLFFRGYALDGDGRILGFTNLSGTNAVLTNASVRFLTVSGLQSLSGNLGNITNGGWWHAGITNGFSSSMTNINPVTSNLVNYGSAIRSEGEGGNSFQIGSNAQATGEYSMAAGNDSESSGSRSLAVGVGARATNDYAIALGPDSLASSSGIAIGYAAFATNGATAIGGSSGARGSSSLALAGATVLGTASYGIGGGIESLGAYGLHIGFGAVGDATYSMVLGHGGTASHSNSAAIGPPDNTGAGVATSTTNQLRMGTARQVLSVPGFIQGTLSNLVTASGQTNVLAGDLSTPRGTVTTVANGANTIDMGTNVVLDLTGSPTTTWSVDGLKFGTAAPRDGHRLWIKNTTGYDATFAHNSGLEPVAAYRISTATSTNVIFTNGATAHLIYFAASSRWILWSVWDGRIDAVTATATNIIGATNFALSHWTNYGGITFATNAITEGNIAYGGFIATNSISFTNGQRQVLQMTNNWLYLQATNLDAMTGGEMRDIEVEVQPQHFWIATNRVIVINSAFKRFSGAVTNTLGSNKIGILRLRRRANTEASVAASWEPEL